ncbi:hypothetical protein DPMN_052769 [Dreissena polymorpha]|uniref:Uncharacterized protein n=1 Tax=Dreissena polymorpha TaxID=45954 RepID=A0A9D4CM39_DREPO|nr:hypothetical protein DPMN_052769 [Dreissena polymorpha]
MSLLRDVAEEPGTTHPSAHMKLDPPSSKLVCKRKPSFNTGKAVEEQSTAVEINMDNSLIHMEAFNGNRVSVLCAMKSGRINFI